LSASLYVLLPAFNEEAALRELIPDIHHTLTPLKIRFTLCLVDDGSTDGTAALAKTLAGRMPLQYVQHAANQGYGAALKTGVLWVLRNARPEDILVTLDADNTHPPAAIPDLIKKIEEGFGAVTGSYTAEGGQARGVPFLRTVLSRGANALFRMRFRFPGVAAYTNGFRAYRVRDLQNAYQRHGERLIDERGFAGGTDLFIQVVRQGARAGEVPFELRYDKRGSGSKIHIPSTILSYLKLLFRYNTSP